MPATETPRSKRPTTGCRRSALAKRAKRPPRPIGRKRRQRGRLRRNRTLGPLFQGGTAKNKHRTMPRPCQEILDLFGGGRADAGFACDPKTAGVAPPASNHRRFRHQTREIIPHHDRIAPFGTCARGPFASRPKGSADALRIVLTSEAKGRQCPGLNFCEGDFTPARTKQRTTAVRKFR
jgi:hypothetical protein